MHIPTGRYTRKKSPTIVKEIIQAHGENIDVVSTEGVGTEFIFSLPKATAL